MQHKVSARKIDFTWAPYNKKTQPQLSGVLAPLGNPLSALNSQTA